MPRPTYASFSEMPVGLRRFLFSKEFAAADQQLQTQFKLEAARMTEVGDVIMDIIFNDLTMTQGMEKIKGLVVPNPVTEANWKSFAAELVKLEFWPIRDLLADELSFWLSDQQIGTGGWPMTRVLVKPLTYSAAASELALRAGFSIMGAQLRERMRDLIMSKVKGVRVDAQIRETLMRQQDFGGLGLDTKQADAAIAALNELLQTVEVLSENEYADWLSNETARTQETKTAKENDAGIDASDDPDIAAIRAKMPAAPPSLLDAAVNSAMKAVTSGPSDEYLSRRLRNAISSRLRDVRNPVEFRQILMRDSKVGGVGLSPDQTEAIAAVVEATYTESHASIMEEEKKKLDAQMAFQQQKVEERKKREAEEHAKWYQDKILAKKQTEEQQSKMTEQWKQSFAAASQAPSPLDQKEKQVEQKRFGDLVPAVHVGAVPIAATAMAGTATAQAGTATMVSTPSASPFAAMAAPVPAAAARPEVRVSQATVQLQDQAALQKPRLDGVTVAKPMSTVGSNAAPRLVGLTGELSELSLTEFRRMAKTPDEAADKILQKIETLAQESFEKRVEGIRAFQHSPLQGVYMALVAESFRTGKQVAILAEEKRAKGESGLSASEIAAVLRLNSKLHF